MDVLKIVSQEIGDKWKTLAAILGIPIPGSECPTTYENMMNCFWSCRYSVSWNLLNHALEQLQEEELIERLKNETNLTQGLI